ncbi:wyosine [tRNA(Phe)-imidazoG37] synthetase (radical SAM superfamily) [Methanolinea mesophila]|uniref:radical SAM protein n=1 Tax=Methanolinea mesophila TaxID=547055 RepID=UPI001AE6369B|nr:radical SAM protein [Methanolinea mesophila]MBP1928817.1 wyosine [tRNA(Phe)-imidazoG37] synthetase (radical SAM superfamily) [Methanolinea mesophila]
MQYHHLFGPVCSRRLGRSLGIDLVPFKVCTFDCVYCECGATTRKTLERQDFFPFEEAIAELTDYLSAGPDLDFITFSGSGEPTLSLSIGRIIRFLKDRFPGYRVAVLTNGGLLHDPGVRADLVGADMVLPTLSTAVPETFAKIHRPAQGQDILEIIDGLSRFRQEFPGEIWLEVFIIPGLNTTDVELAALRKAIQLIDPDRIQLNTLDRPGTEEWVNPAPPAELSRIARFLGLPGTEAVESIHYGFSHAVPCGEIADHILAVLRRRPCTLDDIAAATGFHRREIAKFLREFEIEGRIISKREERGIFFSCRGQQEGTRE